MKKLLAILLLISHLANATNLLFPNNSPAVPWTWQPVGTNYYFSNSGSDGNAGTSTGSPYLSISKFNSLNLVAGDHVYFNKGDVFYGAMKPHNSGTSLNPIVIDAYGTGANPIITGLTTLTGWTNVGGTIWESSAAGSLSTCEVVIINGKMYEMGKYPNSGYLKVDSHTSTSLSSSALTLSFTSARVLYKANQYLMDTVTGRKSGTTFNFVHAPSYAPANGWGAVFTNSPNFLDAEGEWYYNPTTHKVRVQTLSAVAPATPIQAATVTDVLTVNSLSNININNLVFEGGNHNVINLNTCTNVNFSGVEIRYAGNDGIGGVNQGTGHWNNSAVTNCYVHDVNNAGMDLRGADNNLTVTYNTFKRTGMFASQGGVGTQSRMTVWFNSGSGHVVTHNTVDSTGYIAFRVSSQNTLVQYNQATNFCKVIQDGAAFYAARPTLTPTLGGLVFKNNFADGTNSGNFLGTTGTSKLAEGFYIDDGANGAALIGNTAVNCPHLGYYIHDAKNILVRDNTAYNCGSQYAFVFGSTKFYHIEGCGFRNNVGFSKQANQYVLLLWDKSDSLQYFFSPVSDSNYLARPISETQTIYTRRFAYTTSNINNYYSFNQWKGMYGYDVHSKSSPRGMTSPDSSLYKINLTSAAASFPLTQSYMDVKGVVYRGSVTLQPFQSIVLIANGNAPATDTTTVAPPIDTTYVPPPPPPVDTSYVPPVVDTTVAPITPVYWKDTTNVSTSFTMPKVPATPVYAWTGTKGGIVNLPDPSTVASNFSFTWINDTKQPIQCNRYLYIKIGKNWKQSTWKGSFYPRCRITKSSGKYLMTTI